MHLRAIFRLATFALVVNVCAVPVVGAGELYWSQDGGIWQGGTDGAGASQFAHAFDPRGVAVSGTTVLWTDVEPRVPITPTGVVRATERDGTDPRAVAINLPSPAGLDVDEQAGMVYWSDLETNAIMRTPLRGAGAVEKVLADESGISLIHSVALDPQSQKLYFGYVNPLIDGLFPGAIGRINRDGSQLETIVVGLSEPWGVAVDPTAGQVYWTDDLLGRGGLIRRASVDGTDVQDLIDGLQQPRGIAIDTADNQLYWADAGTHKIQRADANVLKVNDVFSALKQPQALALWLGSPWRSGDFDNNGVLDLADINLLTSGVAAGTHDPDLDVNGDHLVNDTDIGVWVHSLKKTWIGDANLDGEFNSGDLVDVLTVGKYEVAVDASWEAGDWTGDRRFTSADLVSALADGGYEVGPRAAVAAVPEPGTMTLLSWAAAMIAVAASRSSIHGIRQCG